MPRRPRLKLREQILSAARREFAASGFSGASLARIGERAGATKGAVYFLFKHKVELFFAALDEIRSGLETALEQAESGAGHPAELAIGCGNTYPVSFKPGDTRVEQPLLRSVGDASAVVKEVTRHGR